jgi:hypothetical protein
MDVSGLFGIERGSDGLLRAIGPQGRRATIGVNDDVAHFLALFWQPDSDDLAAMLANGEHDEAQNEACQFPRNWDLMAPGEIASAFFVKNPDILTMCIPGVVVVRCLEDGLFHMIDETTDEDSVVGLSAEVAAEIIRSWGGLKAAAEHAEEYQGCGSVATVMLERWYFEAMTRGWASSGRASVRVEQSGSAETHPVVGQVLAGHR